MLLIIEKKLPIRFGLNVFKKGDLDRGRIIGNIFDISPFEFSLIYFV